MNYFTDCFTKKFCCFAGRARRQEYWMFLLFNMIAATLLLILDMVIGTFGILYIIYALASLLPAWGVTVRRLHDISKSGWWILISLIPFGGLVLLVFMFLDSTPGENMYGPNPKGV